MITGILDLARRRRQMLSPSSPGSMRSRTIRSMRAASRILSMPRALSAAETRKPFFCRNRETMVRISRSSSTIKMCGVWDIKLNIHRLLEKTARPSHPECQTRRTTPSDSAAGRSIRPLSVVPALHSKLPDRGMGKEGVEEARWFQSGINGIDCSKSFRCSIGADIVANTSRNGPPTFRICISRRATISSAVSRRGTIVWVSGFTASLAQAWRSSASLSVAAFSKSCHIANAGRTLSGRALTYARTAACRAIMSRQLPLR